MVGDGWRGGWEQGRSGVIGEVGGGWECYTIKRQGGWRKTTRRAGRVSAIVAREAGTVVAV